MLQFFLGGSNVITAQAPPLDLLSSGDLAMVKGAWSNRKVKAAYSGPSIRVINTDTTTQTDLMPGFTKANVDALGAVNKMLIVKMYDQSGNGNDLSFQGTKAQLEYLNQPMWDWSKIASSTPCGYASPGGNVFGNNVTNFYVVDPRTAGSSWLSMIQSPSAGKFRFNDVILGAYDQYGEYNTNEIVYDLPADEAFVGQVRRGTVQLTSLFQAGADSMRRNGIALTNSSGVTDTGGTGMSDGVLWLGNLSTISGLQFAGRCGEWICMNGTPSGAGIAALESSQMAYGQNGNRLITHGDSLIAGAEIIGPVEDFSMGAVARNTLGAGWDFYNRGVGGTSFGNLSGSGDLLLNAFTMVDPLFRPSANKNILVIGTGWNDMASDGNGDSPSTYLAHLASYCAARRAVGWKICLTTINEADQSPTQGPGYKARKGAVNDWVIANGLTIADAVANSRNDPHIGDGADTTNSTYYWTDRLHMLNAGYAVEAGYVAVAVATI